MTGRLAATACAVLLGSTGVAHADGIGEATRWNTWFSVGSEVPMTGDFNGDGVDDVITFVRSSSGGSATGDVYVATSNGETAFEGSRKWHGWFSVGDETPRVGDFNGDGLDDVATFIKSTQSGSARGDVYVALSDGERFGSSSIWDTWFGIGDEVVDTGDFNGDGRDDIITFLRSTRTDSGKGDVYVALSNGNGFGPSRRWHGWFGIGKEQVRVGDFNGDGRDDIATFVMSTQSGTPRGDVYVALSNGSSFGSSSRWHSWFGTGSQVPQVGDFDGDGRDDIVNFVKSTTGTIAHGDVQVSLSDGSRFGTTRVWHEKFGTSHEVVMTGRFNRDHKDDIVTFYRSTYSGSPTGDVYVALTDVQGPAGPAELADFGHGTMLTQGFAKAEGTRPLLVVLMNDTEKADWARDEEDRIDFYDDLVFGDFPNAPGYFSENSYGKFTFSRAGVVGTYNFAKGANKNRGPVLAQALRAADADVDFSRFDKDGDGRVLGDELTLLMVDNRSEDNGFAARADTVTLDGVRIIVQGAAVGEQTAFLTLVHELSHTLGTWDLYGPAGQHVSQGFTLLCTNRWGFDDRRSIHMDPFHKLRLGWIRPAIHSVTAPGDSLDLYAANRSPAEWRGSVILYDPRRGTNEYFILEHRKRGAHPSRLYDEDIPDDGLVVWYVQTEDNHVPLHIDGFRYVWTVSGGDQRRGGATTWKGSHGVFGLDWFDGPDSNVRVRVQNFNSYKLNVEWGWRDRPAPNVRLVNDVLAPGWSVVQGDFGAAQDDRRVVLYDPSSPDVVGSRREFDLSVWSWSYAHVGVVVPSNIPRGDYQLRVYEDATRLRAGVYGNTRIE